MSQTHHTKVLIIGAGPAGYTAAIYAARANLSPILVAGMQPGGQLMITTDVENYPGFRRRHPGPVADGADGGAGHPCRHPHHPRPDHRRGFLPPAVPSATATPATATPPTAVIIATGAQARWLGLESEQTLQGRGVSACATCDGFFYRGKTVAVVGGGNTAVEEALYLTHHADKVTLIHRRDSLRAEKILQEQAVRPPQDRRRSGTAR